MPRMLEAVGARRALACCRVLWSALRLKQDDGHAKSGYACKERLDLRVQLSEIILQRLPDLLPGLVVIYANGVWMMRRPVVCPRDLPSKYVLGPLKPLIADERGRPQCRMP